MIREFAKSLFAGLLFYTGFFSLLRFFHNLAGDKIVILTYHRVGKEGETNARYCLPLLFTGDRSFERQVKFLTKYYRIISLEDLIFFRSIPRNSLIITFDDGYEDNYLYAYPVLRRYGIPGTIFLASSHVDSNKTFWWNRMWFIGCSLASYPNSIDFSESIYPREIRSFLAKIRENNNPSDVSDILSRLIRTMENYPLPQIEAIISDLQKRLKVSWLEFKLYNKMLTWNQIKEMQENKINFGSHTRSHANLSLISKQEGEEEIVRSKEDIEKHTGKRIFAFSYPGGRLTETVKEAVKGSGYQCACSTVLGVNVLPIDSFALKRINIWEGKVKGWRNKYSDALFALSLIRHYRS